MKFAELYRFIYFILLMTHPGKNVNFLKVNLKNDISASLSKKKRYQSDSNLERELLESNPDLINVMLGWEVTRNLIEAPGVDKDLWKSYDGRDFLDDWNINFKKIFPWGLKLRMHDLLKALIVLGPKITQIRFPLHIP